MERIAVLASGRGSNLRALLDDEVVGAAITLVVSDRADAGALTLARERGVEAVSLDPAGYADRKEFDEALLTLLQGEGIDVVLLAGFMRILSPALVRAYWGRMLNVHPALLPAFPGAHAVRDALVWGVKLSGATVHFVDEEVDHGPIVLQESVPVFEEDDETSLHSRIQEAEHRLYPRAARLLLKGSLSIDGRRVVVREAQGDG